MTLRRMGRTARGYRGCAACAMSRATKPPAHIGQAGAVPGFRAPIAAAHNARRMIEAGARPGIIVSVSSPHPPPLRPAHGARRGRTPSKPGTATAQVQSLTRGLSILECLARAEGGLTLTDVSHRVALPPSTAHRLLSPLERMGYVYQAGELGRWYVGLQAFAVGSSFLSSRDFVAQSHPYMRRLMEQSGGTASLAILDATEAVFIDQVQCRETMRTIVKLGSRVPLHASGVGKANFAALPDEQLDALIKVKGLPRITENTITTPEPMWASNRVI